MPRVSHPLCSDLSCPAFSFVTLGEGPLFLQCDHFSEPYSSSFATLSLFFPPFQIFAEFFDLIIKSVHAPCRQLQTRKALRTTKEHPSALPSPRGELRQHLASLPPVLIVWDYVLEKRRVLRCVFCCQFSSPSFLPPSLPSLLPSFLWFRSVF